MTSNDRALRAQLTALLEGGHAHVDIRAALADFPFDQAGERPHGLPYSAWQLLEHMRFTLADLLMFSTDSNYLEPKWPDDYWVKDPAPPSREAWGRSVNALEADLETFAALIADENTNLSDPIPWGRNGETLLRAILLAADHNSYHTGELIVLRRLLGVWPV